MNKLIKFLGQKKHNPVRKIIIGLAFLMLFLAYIQYGMSVITNDYIEVPAYITDISGTQKIRKSGPRSEYTYIIHYTYNGLEYSQTQTSGDCPDPDITKAWVARDNSDVTLYSNASMNESTLSFIAISILLFIAWAVLYKKSRLEEADNSEIASNVMITAFISAFTSGFASLATLFCLKHSTAETSIFVNSSLLFVCVIIFLFTLLIGIIARLEMKKWEKLEMLQYENDLRKKYKL